jgi:hypothetical protein
MVLMSLSKNIYDDITSFIAEIYHNDLPNSLLIAQAFILKYPGHGREYGLSVISKVIDDRIKEDRFE